MTSSTLDLKRLLNTPEDLGYTVLDCGGFQAIWILEKEGRITKVMDKFDGGTVVAKLGFLLNNIETCWPRVYTLHSHEDIVVSEMEKLDDFGGNETTMDTLAEAYAGRSTHLGADITQTLSILRKHAGHFLEFDLSPDSLMSRNGKPVITDMFDVIQPEHFYKLDIAISRAAKDIKELLTQ